MSLDLIEAPDVMKAKMIAWKNYADQEHNKVIQLESERDLLRERLSELEAVCDALPINLPDNPSTEVISEHGEFFKLATRLARKAIAGRPSHGKLLITPAMQAQGEENEAMSET